MAKLKVFRGYMGSLNVYPPDGKVLLLDTETTGLDPQNDEIVQLFCESYDMQKDTQRVEHFHNNMFFKAKNGNKAAHVNHLDDHFLRDFAHFTENIAANTLVHDALLACSIGSLMSCDFGLHTLVGQFVHFDLSFLNSWLDKSLLQEVDFDRLLVWDTRSVEKTLNPDADSHSLVPTALRRNVISENDAKNAHDARFDVHVTKLVMVSQLNEIERLNLWTEMEESEYKLTLADKR